MSERTSSVRYYAWLPDSGPEEIHPKRTSVGQQKQMAATVKGTKRRRPADPTQRRKTGSL